MTGLLMFTSVESSTPPLIICLQCTHYHQFFSAELPLVSPFLKFSWAGTKVIGFSRNPAPILYSTLPSVSGSPVRHSLRWLQFSALLSRTLPSLALPGARRCFTGPPIRSVNIVLSFRGRPSLAKMTAISLDEMGKRPYIPRFREGKKAFRDGLDRGKTPEDLFTTPPSRCTRQTLNLARVVLIRDTRTENTISVERTLSLLRFP